MSKIREISYEALPYAAGAGLAAIPGAYGGAAFYNSKIAEDIHATNVHLGEYMDLQVYAQHGGTDIYNGPATDLHLPHLTSNTPFGHIGAHIDIAQLNVPLNAHGFSEVLGLANNLHAVDDSIKHAVMERLAVGTGLGALAAGLVGAYAVHKIRHGALERIAERFRRNRLRTIGAVGLTAGLVSGCGAAVNGEFADNMPSGPSPTPITSIYKGAKNIPALRGATISGAEGSAAKFLVHAVNLYSDAVDKSWQQGTTNFMKAFYPQEAKLVFKMQTDPNVVGVLDIADTHCNYAADKYWFPQVFSALKPDVINNTGDIFTNSDTMPYESGCATDFENAVNKAEKSSGKTIPIINIAGDHDPYRPIPGTITLGPNNNYSAKVDTINFVGVGSLPRVYWSDVPALSVDQKKLIALEGSTLAKRACQIEKQTGEAPFVDVFQHDAGDQVIEDGCAQIVNEAESHHSTNADKWIASNGTEGYILNPGTATGANIGLTIEETQQLPASFVLEYYNKTTRQFIGFITVRLSASNDVSFDNQMMPNYNPPNTYNYGRAASFLRQYPENR